MPRIISIICFVLCLANTHAQNQTKKWFFGNSAGITFSSGSPIFVGGSAITSSMGCSSIADMSGNTLFYTDGVTVYNSANTAMANGTGLLGANAFQSSLIIKQPSSASIYYVFTVGALGSANGLHYSVVDMSLAAGMGSVTVKNVLINADCRDKITAGKHCNGSDVWILSSAVSSTVAFVACPLTATGVGASVLTPVTTSIMPVIGSGQMKLSPNSHRLGIVSYLAPGANCGMDVRIMNFDNSSGFMEYIGSTVVMYNTYTSTSPNCANTFYGCEFSVDSRYMYLSALNQISRIDLCALPVISTGLIPNAENTSIYDTVSKRSFQMAADGRIYVAKNGKTSIGAINNPSSLFATSYSSMGLSLGTSTCQWGLPNMPGYYFEQKPPTGFSYSLSSGNCLTSFFTSNAICAGSGYTVTGYQWNFGDPGSGAANVSSQSNPIHFYSTPGTYSVTMVRYFQCNDNDTIRQVLNVTAPVISVINSPSICTVTSATAQVTASSGTINYLWSPSSQTTAIGTFTSSGIYTVTVTDAGNGFCTVSATTAVSVVNLSTAISTASLKCNNDATGATTVNVSGGSGGYQYFWTGATGSSSVAANLQAGNYTVTVLDNANFCTITKTITIIQPSQLQLSVGGPTQTCLNQTTTLYASGSGGIMGYTYNWIGQGTTNIVTVPQSSVGTHVYTCVATDANTCTAVNHLTVICNPIPSLQVSSATLCAGSNLTLQATGAGNYAWSNGATTPTLVLLAPSDGTLVLLGSLGTCTASTLVSILNLPLPALSVSAGSSLCAGDAFSLSATGQGSFLWNGPNGFISNLSSINIINASTQQSGVYAVSLTSSNTCVSNASITITVFPVPTIGLSTPKTICSGESSTLSVTGVGSYSWSSGETGSVIVVAPAQTTSYSVFVTSPNSGCTAVGSFQQQVSSCIGMQQQTKENNALVFPNPTQNSFTIRIYTTGDFILYAVDGKQVLSGTVTAGDTKIEVGTLPEGIYLLHIKQASSFQNIRLSIRN